MVAARLGEERAALEGLDHEVMGDVAREAEVHRGVDQRLHDQEHVRRAGAAHGGRHRDGLLVVDLDLVAQRPQQGAGLSALVAVVSGRGVPDRHAPSEAGGRVGHAPDDLVVAQDAGQAARGGAGHDRSTSCPRRRHGRSSRPTRTSICGLMPRRITSASSAASVLLADRSDAVLALELLAAFGARMAGDHLRAARRSRPRSSPAIIASAMTPEPTVAIVLPCERGILADHGASIGARQPATARPRRKKRLVGSIVDLLEAGRHEGPLQLARLVVLLDDAERAAVREAAQLDVRRRRRRRSWSRCARLRVRPRVDEQEACRPVAASDGRVRGTPAVVSRDVAQPEPGNTTSTGRSGSAQASRT